jgi:hypothetical protein
MTETMVPEWIYEHVGDRLDKAYIAPVDYLNDKEVKDFFTAHETIQKIIRELAVNQEVMIIPNQVGDKIQTIAMQVNPDVNLESFNVDNSAMWNNKRHVSEFLNQNWFRAFLVADYFKGCLWCLEAETQKNFSDVSCKIIPGDDGWFVIETYEKEEKKIKTTVETQPFVTADIPTVTPADGVEEGQKVAGEEWTEDARRYIYEY